MRWRIDMLTTITVVCGSTIQGLPEQIFMPADARESSCNIMQPVGTRI
jgi:hypothetical protein